MPQAGGIAFFNTLHVRPNSGARRSLCDSTYRPALRAPNTVFHLQVQAKETHQVSDREARWKWWAGQVGGSGRDSHTREAACTSESCSPGRGAERDAQRGKSKPQRPAFRGQPWLSQGPSTPPFFHILVPLPILKKWESLRDINYPEEVTAIYREVFWGSGGTHVEIGGQLLGG